MERQGGVAKPRQHRLTHGREPFKGLVLLSFIKVSQGEECFGWSGRQPIELYREDWR